MKTVVLTPAHRPPEPQGVKGCSGLSQLILSSLTSSTNTLSASHRATRDVPKPPSPFDAQMPDPDAYYRQVYYRQFNAQPEAQPGSTQMYLSQFETADISTSVDNYCSVQVQPIFQNVEENGHTLNNPLTGAVQHVMEAEMQTSSHGLPDYSRKTNATQYAGSQSTYCVAPMVVHHSASQIIPHHLQGCHNINYASVGCIDELAVEFSNNITQNACLVTGEDSFHRNLQPSVLGSDQMQVGFKSKFEKFKFKSTDHQEKRKMPQRRVNTVSFSDFNVSCLEPTPQDDVIIAKEFSYKQPNISEPGGTCSVGQTEQVVKFNKTPLNLPLFDISLSPIFGSSPEEMSDQPFVVPENVVPPSVTPDTNNILENDVMVDTNAGECSDTNATESYSIAPSVFLRQCEPPNKILDLTEHLEGKCPETRLKDENQQISKSSYYNNEVIMNPTVSAYSESALPANACHKVLIDYAVPQDTSENIISDMEGCRNQEMGKHGEMSTKDSDVTPVSHPFDQNIVDETIDKDDVKIKLPYKKPIFKSTVSSRKIKACHLNDKKSTIASGQEDSETKRMSKKQAFKIPYRMTHDSCAPITSTPKKSSISKLKKLKSRQSSGKDGKDISSDQVILKPVEKTAIVHPNGKSEACFNDVPQSLKSKSELKNNSESEQKILGIDKPSSLKFLSSSLKKPDFLGRSSSTFVKAKQISKQKGKGSGMVKTDQENCTDHTLDSNTQVVTHNTDPGKETNVHECIPIDNALTSHTKKSTSLDPFSEHNENRANVTSENEHNAKSSSIVRFSSKNNKSKGPGSVKRKCNEKDRLNNKLSKIDGDKPAMDSSVTHCHSGKEVSESKKQTKGKGKKLKRNAQEKGNTSSNKANKPKLSNKDNSKGTSTTKHKQQKKSPRVEDKKATIAPSVQKIASHHKLGQESDLGVVADYLSAATEVCFTLLYRDGSWQLRERVSSGRQKHPGSGVVTALGLRVIWSHSAAPPMHLLPLRQTMSSAQTSSQDKPTGGIDNSHSHHGREESEASTNGTAEGDTLQHNGSKLSSQDPETRNNIVAVYKLPCGMTTDRDKIWWTALRSLMTSGVRKICFDAQELVTYLVEYLQANHKQVVGTWVVLDPKVGGWLLNPDHPPLTFLQTAIALKAPLPKESNSGLAPEDELWCDLECLSNTTAFLHTLLSQHRLWTIFIHLEMRLLPSLAAMELHGMRVDRNVLKQTGQMLKLKIRDVEKLCHQAAGTVFNVTSHAQLRSVLYQTLKLDIKNQVVIPRTAMGQKSTSETALDRLVDCHPLPALVLQHRLLNKLKTTYVDGILTCLRGSYVHACWEQTTASTGRLQCRNPNLQNIPKQPVSVTVGGSETVVYVRECFSSREGMVLVSVDFQQTELRMLAHLSQDAVLLAGFRQTVTQAPDIFKQLSSIWLGKEVGEVTGADRERTKRVVYGVMYGAGRDKLAEVLHITSLQAKDIVTSFISRFPSIPAYMRRVVEQCKLQGFLTTIFHRRRYFPGITSQDTAIQSQAERQAVNFVIQGSAADISKAAMVQTEAALAEHSDLDASLLIHIHDELVWEVSTNHIHEFIDLVGGIMEDAQQLCGPLVQLTVPLPVAIFTGSNWAHMSAYRKDAGTSE